MCYCSGERVRCRGGVAHGTGRQDDPVVVYSLDARLDLSYALSCVENAHKLGDTTALGLRVWISHALDRNERIIGPKYESWAELIASYLFVHRHKNLRIKNTTTP